MIHQRTESSHYIRFPRLYAAASLKLLLDVVYFQCILGGFPRLYAAASLKHLGGAVNEHAWNLCFPRLYAAASLKRGPQGEGEGGAECVFRGFMPRPH